MEALEHGQLFVVTADMCAIAASAAETIPFLDVTRDTPYTTAGVMLFDEPIAVEMWEFQSGGQEPRAVQALAWIPDPENRMLLVMAFGEMQLTTALALPFDQHVPTVDDHPWVQLLVTSWHLMKEVLSEVTTEKPRPRARRRARRRLIDDTAVRVVRLRRVERSRQVHVGERARPDWQHRWIVNAHWTQQAYGPGRSLRRLQWISAYEKGPQDKPLKVREKVVVWDR